MNVLRCTNEKKCFEISMICFLLTNYNSPKKKNILFFNIQMWKHIQFKPDLLNFSCHTDEKLNEVTSNEICLFII
jgi:hypothetical protein